MGDALTFIDEGSDYLGGVMLDGIEDGINISTEWIATDGYDGFEEAVDAIKNVTFDVFEWTIDLFD